MKICSKDMKDLWTMEYLPKIHLCMIKSMHNIRTMGNLEPQVASLSRRLLQTEQNNINQMKHYL